MAWQLSMNEVAELLVHRCKLIAFEDDIDLDGLRAGTPAACLPILRYLFSGFSEAVADFFYENGHEFRSDMSDEQLVERILSVWSVLSPQRPVGDVTVAKFLQPGAWGTDRLLFTLQCVAVCCQKHREVVAEDDEAWLQSGIDWTSTSPQQQFDERPLVGTESQQLRSTVAWMAEAYREQMESLGHSSCADVGGADEQQAWIERMRHNALDEGSVSCGSCSTSCVTIPAVEAAEPTDSVADSRGTEESHGLMGPNDMRVYAAQLGNLAAAHAQPQVLPLCTVDYLEVARQHRAAVAALDFGPLPGTEDNEDDTFDSSMEISFISDSPPERSRMIPQAGITTEQIR